MLTITIDTYDCDQYTSLTADDVGALYVAAVRRAFPAARVILAQDGKGVRVHGDDAEHTSEADILADVRAILGDVWQRACEDHPYEPAE